MISGRIAFLPAIALLLTSCGPQPDRTPALAQAFVGPATLTLRQELSIKSPVSATVHHGEPLDILEYKRRFIKVRTAGGITGWTDVKQLLSPEQMKELRRLARGAATDPSQGTASTYESLNVHTEPSRTSPSFLQIPEGGKVEVVGHKVTPRTQAPTPMPLPPPKPRIPRRRSKDKGIAKIQPPPMPEAPKPPPNWLALSQPAIDPHPPPPPPPAAPPLPVRLDDWTLIRTKDGRSGWVLSRMLTMSIPDDVAQYAEGHRITSYFQMGDVKDEDLIKHNYLWTTVRSGTEPYEFDSWRFFVWSKHRHRYETAYIQRSVIGHYPVRVNTSGPEPMFTLILEDEAGNWFKKTFTFNGYRVLLVESVPYDKNAAGQENQPSVTAAPGPDSQKPAGWSASLKDRLNKLLHH